MHCDPTALMAGVEIAGPGFINFRLTPLALHREIERIFADGPRYGESDEGAGRKVVVEFVSANPTGPLHVGHGRHAAYGDSVASLLAATGHDVHREYYVNDAGRQMDILAVSVWLRYLELCGESIGFPDNGYRGEYIYDIARIVRADHGDQLRFTPLAVEEGLPPSLERGGDGEVYLDALIARAKELLGEEGYHVFFDTALDNILGDIKEDLAEFGVTFDRWFSEQSLTTEGRIDAALAVLEKSGKVYEKDGAKWFRATDFGDEKDRVVVRDNGQTTYIASDIAYHLNKRQRGNEQLLDILGADHHGYVTRVRGGLEAMGYEADDLEVQFVQFVTLYRSGKRVQMGTRSGQFDTLRQLREEVGNDAARFYYVMRSNDQHLDFDLDVATSQSNDNPVYYIQYAHARVASVFRQLDEKSLSWDEESGREQLELLVEPQEKTLMTTLSRYPEVVELAANNRAPQHLVHYLRDLANDFHTYYNAHAFIVDDADLRNARLYLITATRTVIANGLGIIGVSAPEKM